MNWRVWSKLCCGQKWLLLLLPFLFLFLFLMIGMMTMTLPPPLPLVHTDRRSSRALSSTGGFRSMPRIVDPPSAAAFQQHLHHIHRSRTSPAEHTSESSHRAAGEDKNSIKVRGHAGVHRNKHRNVASTNKEVAGAIQSAHHPQRSNFTVNNKQPERRINPRSHTAVVKPTAQAPIYLKQKKSTRASRPSADGGNKHPQGGRHTNSSKHQQKLTQPAKTSGENVDKKHCSVKKPSRDQKKLHYSPENPPEEKLNTPPDPRTAENRGGWCRTFREQDFSDSDLRRIRVSRHLQPLPWFSKEDVEKMELLAGGEVLSKARVPAHGQVLQVALDHPEHHQVNKSHQNRSGAAESHSESCQQGLCSLVKRVEDWFEVFAFHLDRVLGLNRTLPAVLRTFHSPVLPYRYINGSPRPAVWWDPDIQHLADEDSDQNSVTLSWVQYQNLLQARCGNQTDLRSEPCVGVHHSEWGRLALFDFLLQVNDRLDRYCCGFRPDPAELCVENLLHNKCGTSKDLLLVHILVRKADPSRLVFIDNSGRPQQTSDNLNFRLVEGIDEFPEKAVSVLHSGCLESLLLRSLYTDKEFWDSRGGAAGLRPLVHVVEQRGQILLQHIRDKTLHLQRDL